MSIEGVLNFDVWNLQLIERHAIKSDCYISKGILFFMIHIIRNVTEFEIHLVISDRFQ